MRPDQTCIRTLNVHLDEDRRRHRSRRSEKRTLYDNFNFISGGCKIYSAISGILHIGMVNLEYFVNRCYSVRKFQVQHWLNTQKFTAEPELVQHKGRAVYLKCEQLTVSVISTSLFCVHLENSLDTYCSSQVGSMWNTVTLKRVDDFVLNASVIVRRQFSLRGFLFACPG